MAEADRGRELPLERLIANQRRDRTAGMERFVAGMFADRPEDRTVDWLWSIGTETPLRVAVETLGVYRDPDAEGLAAGLGALSAPGAVLHGTRDRAATRAEAAAVAREVLDGRYVPFEESAHAPFLEQPERFEDRLTAFLDD